MKTLQMPHLGPALDKLSYEWLAAKHPETLTAVESEVAARHTPEQIKLFVVLHTGRLELALRCEQAARWLMNSQSQ